MNKKESPPPLLIAHIVYSLGTGGLENGLVNLINRSDSSRFQHMVICLTTAGRFAERILVDDVTIIELNKPAGHSLKTYRRLRSVIQKYRPNIVHSRNLAALESQIATLGLRGIKRVHGEHGRDFNDPEGKNWKYNALRRLSRLWIDHYVAVSGELRDWLVNRIGVSEGRILQQPNGVDCEIFRSDLIAPTDLPSEFTAEETLVIGTVGRLVPIKDQKNLIQGFSMAQKQLLEQGITLALMIVGDGPLMSTLRAQAEETCEQPLVWFTGDRSDVNRLLGAMNVFVLPSIAEGVSNTLLEAMATGLAVMSTSVGGAPDIIEDGVDGILFKVGDPGGLSRELIRMAQDRDSIRALGHQARTKVEQDFSWPMAVSCYESLYQSLRADFHANSERGQLHAHSG